MQLILGIDPGTNIMGYGILGIDAQNKLHLVEMGVLKLDKLESHFEKLHKIFEKVSQLIVTHEPIVLVTEAPFYGKNVQSMLKLGRAQGAALAAGLHHHLPVFEYLPRVVKQQITGQGSSTKEQVAYFVKQIVPFPDAPEYYDATDAVAVALCHYYHATKKIPAQKTPKKKKSSSWAQFIDQNKDRMV